MSTCSIRRRRDSMSIETLALIPALALLLVGGIEFGKIALTYYQLQKALRGAARMLSVLRGANFCDSTDPQIDAIKNFIVYGPGGNTADPIVQGLTPDAITVTPERLDADTGSIGACDCSGASGCLASDGGRAP
ncbi:MAG TPA: TadE/TadG family type IV pilus assembly protein, partial [Bryobacterales bacterium]|nr:TadE/TadG family type IV pilus assembly protein [Bryobacterales bacterium]